MRSFLAAITPYLFVMFSPFFHRAYRIHDHYDQLVAASLTPCLSGAVCVSERVAKLKLPLLFDPFYNNFEHSKVLLKML